MNEEKKPVALVGCVNVPPGVLVSSTVGVSGSGMAFESLLGSLADCARRCRMLSTELNGRPGGEPGSGFDVTGLLSGKVAESAFAKVGVGGVTSVVGVSTRFGGVLGSEAVLMRDLPRGSCFGVSGLSSLGRASTAVTCGRISGSGTDTSGSGTETLSSTFVGSLASCELTLLLLLFGLNSPPRLPLPLLSDLTESVSPPACLRASLNAPLSFSPGEGARLSVVTDGKGSVSDGSMI
jgi:hypothetical protein